MWINDTTRSRQPRHTPVALSRVPSIGFAGELHRSRLNRSICNNGRLLYVLGDLPPNPCTSTTLGPPFLFPEPSTSGAPQVSLRPGLPYSLFAEAQELSASNKRMPSRCLNSQHVFVDQGLGTRLCLEEFRRAHFPGAKTRLTRDQYRDATGSLQKRNPAVQHQVHTAAPCLSRSLVLLNSIAERAIGKKPFWFFVWSL